ncbi:MAG TPA: efflux RND transporter periplasmic adaptor subunit [Candidatus Ornithospirochaeta stercorigallinarum]|nr:efflux RND transporter periplasmic adaptor subunit [Candidatus Ornithospirochaeta stercorigallinarum]
MLDKEKRNSDIESLSELEERKLRAAYAARKRRKRIKTVIAWALVLLIIGTLYVMYTQYQEDRAREAEAMNQSVYAETTVMLQSYQMSIDLSGYIEPYDIQEAKFRTTGPVTGVYVEEGDHVEKGQLLASIDSTSQQASLQNIRNQLEEAKLAGAERDVELLSLEEKAAMNTLDYTNIYANFDGVVTSVDVDEGDYFEAGDLTVLTLVDISKLKATVEIDEIDMQYVKEGMSAYLTFDSMPGETIEAYVSYIPMLGRYSDSGIGVVDVELTIDNPPSSIIPGYSFEGIINVEGDVSMLIVPQASVTMSRGGVTTVNRKLPDGSTETVQVQVQYLGENLVQILSSNISEGDVLVYQTKSGMSSMMRMMGGGPR